jgi:hypothetical protein
MKSKQPRAQSLHQYCASTIALLLLLAASGNSAAQDRIYTNRPGFSVSPYVLKPGVWQLESGIHYEKGNQGAGSSLLSLPLPSVRYGLMDETEVLLEWDGISRFRSDNNNATGITDPSIGVKFQLTEDQAAAAFAFQVGLSLPIGEDEFSSNSWDPSIGLAWAHSGSLLLAGTAVLRKSGGDYQVDNGIKIILETSTNSSGFFEWEANIPNSGGVVHKLNGGFLWLPAPHMQWDINAQVGLNDRAPDYGLGLGFSYRY